MVILGRELKPGAGRWQGGGEEAGAAAARLAGAALAAAAVPGLQGCIPWYNAVLGLQLVSLGDSALLATGELTRCPHQSSTARSPSDAPLQPQLRCPPPARRPAARQLPAGAAGRPRG